MEAFAERLRDAVAFGAYIDGEIIGLSVFKQEDGPKDAHKAHLSGVFVEPEQRGRGVAGMLLRALPAGLLLVMIVRQIPTGIWWMRIFILGALNISLFWSLLFISVYRLPGGVAATVGAVQPLMVVFISAALLGSPIRLMAVLGAICGTAGVALLVLTPNAALDPVGVAAGLAGAVSMAFGTVLTRKWQPPVPLLTFTAWQLAAGGLLLVPVALGFNLLALVPGDLATRTYSCFLTGLSQPGDRRVARMVVLGSDAECASNHRRPARDREYLAGPTFQPHS